MTEVVLTLSKQNSSFKITATRQDAAAAAQDVLDVVYRLTSKDDPDFDNEFDPCAEPDDEPAEDC